MEGASCLLADPLFYLATGERCCLVKLGHGPASGESPVAVHIGAFESSACAARLLPYEDPVPEGVGDLAPLVQELNIQKFIMINTQARLLTHFYDLREERRVLAPDVSKKAGTVCQPPPLVPAWAMCTHRHAAACTRLLRAS